MNILQINSTDSPVGGATKVGIDIKNGLEKSDIKNTLFVGTKFSEDSQVFEFKKSIYAKYISRLLANDIDYFKTDSILDTDVFRQADLVHAHNLHGWYFNLETLTYIADRKPVVWTLHDEWAITAHCGYSFSDHVEDGFYQCRDIHTYPALLWDNTKHLCARKESIYRDLDVQLVVPSQWLKRRVEKSILQDKKIHLIYNGVDTDFYTPGNKNALRQKLNLPLDKKIILFIATGGVKNMFKGGDYVKDVAAYYRHKDKNVVFVCVGGDEPSYINGNIMYVQKIQDRNKLQQYYAASDVFLFTSLAENFPLVILEAMSSGLPVVSFDVGGVAEALEHKVTGYVGRYKDVNDIVEGVEYIQGLEETRYNDMCSRARRRVVEHFSLETMIKHYIDLYHNILDI